MEGPAAVLPDDKRQMEFLVGTIGGRDRARTGDPLLAKQVLSQLSYTPTLLILSHYDGLRTPARRFSCA